MEEKQSKVTGTNSGPCSSTSVREMGFVRNRSL